MTTLRFSVGELLCVDLPGAPHDGRDGRVKQILADEYGFHYLMDFDGATQVYDPIALKPRGPAVRVRYEEVRMCH
jgi:hypothetical protein